MATGLLEAEHGLLERVFPRHVIEHMTSHAEVAAVVSGPHDMASFSPAVESGSHAVASSSLAAASSCHALANFSHAVESGSHTTGSCAHAVESGTRAASSSVNNAVLQPAGTAEEAPIHNTLLPSAKPREELCASSQSSLSTSHEQAGVSASGPFGGTHVLAGMTWSSCHGAHAH